MRTDVPKAKILFVAEAVTLAHVARPLALSAALDTARYELALACDVRSRWLLRDFAGLHIPLASIGSGAFLAALARGAPLYDEGTLAGYVRDDLRVLETYRPDVVIGDFRLSLSVSARRAGIPYVALSNCYWSPHWRPARYPVPDLPITRALPLPLADALFRLARRAAFALHARPLNRVRRRYGLASLGRDLRCVYTDADHVLYADLPALYPHLTLPAHHQVIGPVLWSPPVEQPVWWSGLREDRPVVYVTLGSSGVGRLLPEILHALSPLNVTVIAASAGAPLAQPASPNSHVADYVPGGLAAARADLVICNGGAPTSQQALLAGKPVIGIPGNLDQFLNMQAVEGAGAGVVMRADRFDAARLASLVECVLGSDVHRAASARLAQTTRADGSLERFRTLVARHTWLSGGAWDPRPHSSTDGPQM